MILNCPKCKTEITSNAINIKEGIAQCGSCSEVFKIASYIKNSDTIKRIAKPIYSEIEVESTFYDGKITIPPMGISKLTLFFLVITIGFNVFIFSFVLKEKSAFVFVFIAIVCFSVISMFGKLLFSYKGFIILEFSKELVSVTWKLLGLKFSRKKPANELDVITEDVMYTKNYQPVYGIGLYFKGNKKIKFAAGLKEEERKWLIGELHEMKAKFK